MDEKVTVTPGQRFRITLPWSEVCIAMRVADSAMDAQLDDSGMVQLFKDGRNFSAPVTAGEAGLYRDSAGAFYGYDITPELG